MIDKIQMEAMMSDIIILIIADTHTNTLDNFHDSWILILWKHFNDAWVGEISEGGVTQINWQNKDDREGEMYQARENDIYEITISAMWNDYS